ncbi:MAG: YraN family protein [Chloroflexi bacterium]|nr:YraN family protein [Chloroflexota bacterium]
MLEKSPATRHSSTRTGNIGEHLARVHLETHHYRVLETNYRCRWGEVDLIVERGPFLVFVEVKTRRSNAFGSPEEALTAEKARRLVLTAQHYLERHSLNSAENQWRIDLIAIRMGPDGRVLNIQHMENVVEC